MNSCSDKENAPDRSYLDPLSMYGVTKVSTPQAITQNFHSIFQVSGVLCNYFFHKYGVDVRVVRYPGRWFIHAHMRQMKLYTIIDVTLASFRCSDAQNIAQWWHFRLCTWDAPCSYHFNKLSMLFEARSTTQYHMWVYANIIPDGASMGLYERLY
jgi:hypothetical protein